MLSYLFGGLGELVAPRTISNKEVKCFLENGDFDRVLDLIKQPPHDINVNELYDSGLTPLHLATAGGALELTIELLSQGADITVCSATSKNTPLHFASMNNFKAIVEVLLRSGADPSVPNADGLIPAEITTLQSLRDVLVSSNLMSQSNVYPTYEQRRGEDQDEVYDNQQNSKSKSLPDTKVQSTLQESDRRPRVPPLCLDLPHCGDTISNEKLQPPNEISVARGNSDETTLNSSRDRIMSGRQPHQHLATTDHPSISLVSGAMVARGCSNDSVSSSTSSGEYRVLSARRLSKSDTKLPPESIASSSPASPRSGFVDAGHSLPLPHTIPPSKNSQNSLTSPRTTPRGQFVNNNLFPDVAGILPPAPDDSLNSPLHVPTSKRRSSASSSKNSSRRSSTGGYVEKDEVFAEVGSKGEIGLGHEEISLTSQLFPVIGNSGVVDQASFNNKCILPPPFSRISDSPPIVSDKSEGDNAVSTPHTYKNDCHISKVLLENKNLTERILQAVSCTADSAATMYTEFKDRSEVFKLCSRPNFQVAMAERLKNLVADKPELAVCRAVDMGNQASDGWTPLHCAAKFGNNGAAEILLRCDGVTGWECDMLGRLPLHIAAGKSNADLCKMLMEVMQGRRTEEEKSYSTPPSASRSLVGPSAPVDASGTTPLGSATREGKGKPSDAMRELLYQPRDSSIFANSPYVARSGRTPFKRVHSSLRLRSTVKSVVEEKCDELKNEESEVFDMNISFAHSEAQGWRGEMEDQTILLCPIRRDDSPMEWCAFGVLDGHGGCFTSKFIKDALSNLLCQNMGALYTSKDDYVSTETVKEVLENSFVQADSALASEPRMSVKSKVKPPPRNQITDTGKDVHEFVTIDNSGSTACLCLIGSSDIITANIGDARAVLAQKHGNSFCSVDMSNDHKPHLEDERSRIQKSGCRINLIKNMENSFEITTPLHPQVLRVARSFGDFRFKWTAETESDDNVSQSNIKGFRFLPPLEQAVTCFPEVISRKRSNRDLFIILACDGVWDVLSSQEAVEFVFNAFRDKANNGDDILSESVVTSVSDSLVQECLDRGSTDNISVVLVTLSSMSQECFTSCLATVDSDLNLGGITTNLGFTDEDQDVAELQGNIILDPSPPPVNVIKVMADMNQNLPPSSPMKGTRLF